MRLKEFKADLNPNSSRHSFSAHKNVLNKLLVGNLQSDFKNRGFEFEDFREYTTHDDAQRIDWRASLRTNEILIRQTIEEKSVNVLFLVDVSDSMLFSSGEKLKCEFAAEIVCALSWAIQREGNAIGLCMFNEEIVKSLNPKVGADQYYNMMQEISNPSNYGGGCNLKKGIRQSLAMLRVPALVIIISDFIDLGQEWNRYLEVISLNYDLIGINVRDILDRRFPKHSGYFIIENPFSKNKMLIDTKQFFKKYRNIVGKDEEQIEQAFNFAKSTCVTLQTNQDYFNQLIMFLEKRARIPR